jgi:trk system potassium uptake protein TrkA
MAVDRTMSKVEAIKDQVTHAICIDAADPAALQSLPVKEAEAVIVSIGEDVGASVIIAALARQLGAKRLLCRAITEIHNTVLQSIGVDLVLRPEQESALRLAAMIDLPSVSRSFWSEGAHSICEVALPNGSSYGNVGALRKQIGRLQVVAVLRPEGTALHTGKHCEVAVLSRITDDTPLRAADAVLVMGLTSEMRNLRL